MQGSLISIIIPVYNRGNLIEKTLNSIEEQSHHNWECIIVDDWSIDTTEDVVKRYIESDKRFKYFKRPLDKPKGANACRNYGFTKAKGEFIQWFDSDDLMHPDLLKLQLENLHTSNKKISICNFSFFNNTHKPSFEKGFNPLKKEMSEQNALSSFVSGKLILNTQVIMFQAEMVQDVIFNEELYRAQDLDFVFRVMIKFQDQWNFLDKTLVSIRRHEQSITGDFKKRSLKLVESELYVRKMIWENFVNDKDQEAAFAGTLKMYLTAMKYLLYVKSYRKFFKHLLIIFQKVSKKNKLLSTQILAIAIMYIITNKGIVAYQNCLNKI